MTTTTNNMPFEDQHLDVDGPNLFLEDGSVEMDSNIVERAIRPIALNRKTRCSRSLLLLQCRLSLL
jgi:hypothetical protein